MLAHAFFSERLHVLSGIHHSLYCMEDLHQSFLGLPAWIAALSLSLGCWIRPRVRKQPRFVVAKGILHKLMSAHNIFQISQESLPVDVFIFLWKSFSQLNIAQSTWGTSVFSGPQLTFQHCFAVTKWLRCSDCADKRENASLAKLRPRCCSGLHQWENKSKQQ